MEEEYLSKLKTIFELSKELTKVDHPVLQGDVQRIVAIVADKLRLLDPENYFEHVVEFE